MTQEQIKTFREGFKLTSTGTYEDTGKTDVKRQMLAHYIRKSGTENWEMLGYKQESFAVASNYESNPVTDVTGATYNDITGKAEAIEMSEYNVNPNKTKFLEEAIKLKITNAEEEMQDYEILTVYGFLRNSENKCLATLEKDCTVVLENLGGQGFTHSDVNITLSGVKTFGTVKEISSTPTFEEYTA